VEEYREGEVRYRARVPAAHFEAYFGGTGEVTAPTGADRSWAVPVHERAPGSRRSGEARRARLGRAGVRRGPPDFQPGLAQGSFATNMPFTSIAKILPFTFRTTLPAPQPLAGVTRRSLAKTATTGVKLGGICTRSRFLVVALDAFLIPPSMRASEVRQVR
jgi:hypothetical protein